VAKILLIGAIHEYQRESAHFSIVLRPHPARLKLYRDQRAEYQKWLRQQIHKFGPQLIFDEMNLAEEDHEDRLEDTGVPWIYMDIPQHVRTAFGLSVARSADNPIVEEVDRPRELFWQTVVRTLTQLLNLDRATVICGAAHLESFSDKLRQDGHELVQILDVRKAQWIDLGWAPEILPPAA
jgi:hypothetical protein